MYMEKDNIKKLILVDENNPEFKIVINVNRRENILRKEWIEWSFTWDIIIENKIECWWQIYEYIKDEDIRNLWKKYHLNWMSAWTIEQDKEIERYKKENNIERLEYEETVEVLKMANLYEVEYEGKKYKYWHWWIYQANPLDKEINDFYDKIEDKKEIKVKGLEEYYDNIEY